MYAARANMDPLVINNGIGALEKAEKIENYYGMEHPVSGKELFETGLAQAKALGVRILEAQVLGIGGFYTFTGKTTAGDFDTISVILATGSKRKAPAIPGIKELEGRGVSYCAVCDAFFYRGKDVAVLGNSDFALHEAEELEHAKDYLEEKTFNKLRKSRLEESYYVLNEAILKYLSPQMSRREARGLFELLKGYSDEEYAMYVNEEEDAVVYSALHNEVQLPGKKNESD